MGKLFKHSNAVLYVTLGILILIAGIFRLGDTVNQRLKQLPIKNVASAAPAVVADVKREIYPVWVVQASARQTEIHQGSVEDIFGKAEAAAVPGEAGQAEKALAAAPKPSRAELFQQRFVIAGYGFNGIFVGEVFYRAGESMPELAFVDSDGVSITPKLIDAQNGSVAIDLGGQRLLIKDRIGALRGAA